MFVRLIVSEVIVNTNYNSFGYKIVVNAVFVNKNKKLCVAFREWKMESNCWSYFFTTVKVKVKAFILVKP